MIGLPTADDVLAFWFGTAPIAAPCATWFDRSDAFDADIRARFLPLWEALCAGSADTWMDTPLEAIARIVVLDQFPRNMFRDSPKAYASDAQARGVAERAIARGFDRALPFHQRSFLYLPFEHSEDIADQRRCVQLFRTLAEEQSGVLREQGLELLKYAERHCDIIARFGRFPHRNQALGRETTEAEARFLEEPMSSF